LLVAGSWFAVSPATAAPAFQQMGPAPQGDALPIYFFWGDGCPHCAAAHPVLQALAAQYPNVTLHEYEVWYHEENREPYAAMGAKFGFEPSAVPVIYIGARYWEGFAEEPTGREIRQYVAACATQGGCPDAGAGVLSPVADAGAGDATPAANSDAAGVMANTAATTLQVPFLGEIDLGAQSLVVSTALIALIDGFNPCSLWVLSVLLTLTLNHSGSRKKVLIIGLVFLTVTSLVYVAFIAGLFTLFSVLSWVWWIRSVVALVALFFAVVNIKDYFWYKEGLSLTIADEQKPGIYRQMRRVLQAGDSLPAQVGAAAVLGAGVSLVEFSCTAGFPMIWTNLVSAQEITTGAFVMLLALYMVIYQLDELVIFGTAVVTMRAARLEEKQGRILKLAGGVLMFILGIVMLVDPALMNDLTSALLIFGIALAAMVAILFVHRWLLPRLGIVIGSEFRHQSRQQRRHHR
jgi:cytochrome c biogenesis protein CcdA/thiol-disulfide isomerase/thioredoxin